MTFGSSHPVLTSPIPGARCQAYIDRLAQAECPALTARRARRQERSGAPQDPIVWQRARGANVEDVDGNVFVDMCAGFGVAALGHNEPTITAAIREQSLHLSHALGDLHPSVPKIELLEALAALSPWPDTRVIAGLHGADAVEAACKSAVLASGRPGVIAFEGGYHGLHYGTLAMCGYQEAFRTPFARQLGGHVRFAPFPDSEAQAAATLRVLQRHFADPAVPIGALIFEPIQGRGGVRIAPESFWPALRRLCTEYGVLLIADEIYTGLGRCGETFLSQALGAEADLICVGKALGGGLPVSACLGPEALMRAWGDPSGEAIHTATFLANPLGCAASLAFLTQYHTDELPELAKARGASLRPKLEAVVARSPQCRPLRMRGLMVGIDLGEPLAALGLSSRLLSRGYITLPAGADASVLQLSPPLNISEAILHRFAEVLGETLQCDGVARSRPGGGGQPL